MDTGASLNTHTRTPCPSKCTTAPKRLIFLPTGLLSRKCFQSSHRHCPRHRRATDARWQCLLFITRLVRLAASYLDSDVPLKSQPARSLMIMSTQDTHTRCSFFICFIRVAFRFISSAATRRTSREHVSHGFSVFFCVLGFSFFWQTTIRTLITIDRFRVIKAYVIELKRLAWGVQKKEERGIDRPHKWKAK